MKTHLPEGVLRTFDARELEPLAANLQSLQRNLVMLPLRTADDVLFDLTGRLPCGYRMAHAAVQPLLDQSSPGMSRALNALSRQNPLPWSWYRDIVGMALRHCWPLLRQYTLFGTRNTRTVDAVGNVDYHVSVTCLLDDALALGRLHSAMLRGRRLQLWLEGTPLADGYAAAYLMEADEGAYSQWRFAKAVLTPYGGVIGKLKNPRGYKFNLQSTDSRRAALRQLAWTDEEVRGLWATVPSFLSQPVDLLAADSQARYKLPKSTRTRLSNTFRREQVRPVGQELLRYALQLRARSPRFQPFNELVRRAAFYWLTSRRG